jgi:hypothetical protein
MPDEYLLLDGNSLSTDDLLQLGKGLYKIRLTKGDPYALRGCVRTRRIVPQNNLCCAMLGPFSIL